MVGPLYGAIDIMVYKSADPKDVGSITSTNSCIRNVWNATLGFASGWIIFWCGHNYRIGYIMGFVAATAGFTLLWVYRWLMAHPAMVGSKRKPALGLKP